MWHLLPLGNQERKFWHPLSEENLFSILWCLWFLTICGALGGILIAWKGSLFTSARSSSNNYAITIDFSSRHDNSKWKLTCVYGPCTTEGKGLFLNWFKNVQMPPNTDRIVLGDFNLIRKLEDKNKPGGDLAEIFRFNATISQLGINEIVLEERKYTWSNMQP